VPTRARAPLLALCHVHGGHLGEEVVEEGMHERCPDLV